jgi:alpha/beta superfamily hydrolase
MAVAGGYVRFASAGEPAVRLEGILGRPAAALAGSRCPAAVLCHPQPAASSMRDPLLVRLETDLVGGGFVTLRYNFRGVGASEGQSSDGRLEPLDLAGAVDFLLEQGEVNGEKLAIVGHAFGGAMALAEARYDRRVRTVVAVSPPIFRIVDELPGFDRPVLLVTGEYDEVCPEFKLSPLAAQLPRLQGIKIVTGARHLMRGSEATASAIVAQYLAVWAATPGV